MDGGPNRLHARFAGQQRGVPGPDRAFERCADIGFLFCAQFLSTAWMAIATSAWICIGQAMAANRIRQAIR